MVVIGVMGSETSRLSASMFKIWCRPTSAAIECNSFRASLVFDCTTKPLFLIIDSYFYGLGLFQWRLICFRFWSVQKTGCFMNSSVKIDWFVGRICGCSGIPSLQRWLPGRSLIWGKKFWKQLRMGRLMTSRGVFKPDVCLKILLGSIKNRELFWIV